jgi:tetratricopeptide (TPR) repeat protein
MSTRRSARHLFVSGDGEETNTISLFVKNHTSPEHLLQQIEGLAHSGQTHEAQALCENIINAEHALLRSSAFFVLHAKILFELYGNSQKTAAAIRQALLVDPICSSALEFDAVLKSQGLLQDGLYAAGEASLRELLALHPLNAYAAFALAQHLLWKNGPENEAILWFEHCLQLRPRFLTAQLGLAYAYKKVRNFAKADLCFKECIRLDRNTENHPLYKQHLQNL